MLITRKSVILIGLSQTKRKDTQTGVFSFGCGRRTRFAFCPLGKLKVRLRQAVAGGAPPRRISMGSSPLSSCLDKKNSHLTVTVFSYLVAGGGLEPPTSGL